MCVCVYIGLQKDALCSRLLISVGGTVKHSKYAFEKFSSILHMQLIYKINKYICMMNIDSSPA